MAAFQKIASSNSIGTLAQSRLLAKTFSGLYEEYLLTRSRNGYYEACPPYNILII